MTIDLRIARAALRGFEPSEYADTPELAMAWRKRATEAVAPLIEAAVREQIARDIEADAAGIAKAAEGWRTSERHPVNSDAAARYDRVNAEVREAMAKHLRTVTIPTHVRGEQR